MFGLVVDDLVRLILIVGFDRFGRVGSVGLVGVGWFGGAG